MSSTRSFAFQAKRRASSLCVLFRFCFVGLFFMASLQIQHEGGTPSMPSSSFAGAFRSASKATGTTGILISLAFAVLVVGFVVIRRRRLTSARGHTNFDKKVRVLAAC